MATVVESEARNDEAQAKKRGKYLPLEDLIMVREVAAQRAHVATYGAVRQNFEQVATKVNSNPHMTQKVTWKAVQDRYKRLQDDFDADDARNSGLSGVAGGAMGELYQALSQMREDRESFQTNKDVSRAEKTKKEEEKERLGRQVVEMALLRKSQRSGSSGSSDVEGEEDGWDGRRESGSARRKRSKRAELERVELTGGLALFGEKLKEADMARVRLEE